jgi:GAF domain-containing protein
MSGQYVGSVALDESDNEWAHDDGGRIGLLARSAVTMLGGDVAVIESESATALATAETGMLAAPSQLIDPLTAMRHGFHAQISVPVRLNGDRIGTIAVLCRLPRNFDADDIAALRDIATRISAGSARPIRVLH